MNNKGTELVQLIKIKRKWNKSNTKGLKHNFVPQLSYSCILSFLDSLSKTSRLGVEDSGEKERKGREILILTFI